MEDIRSIARGTIVALQIYRFKIYLPATMYTRVAEKAMETYEHPGAAGLRPSPEGSPQLPSDHSPQGQQLLCVTSARFVPEKK
jgi:hypothetical protein